MNPVADEKTGLGNYFIANYPPFSFWKPSYLPDAMMALNSPPVPGTPLGLYLHIPFCRKHSPGIQHIDLIDAEHLALDAARTNITDERAAFHWLDLTTEAPPHTYDAIICNPPFHTGRASTPELGQQVIDAASRALRPGGRFYMVANRGLPYERMLKANFTSFETLADNNKFRITRALR